MIENKQALLEAMDRGNFQAVDDMLAQSIEDDLAEIDRLAKEIEIRKVSESKTIAMRASLAVLRLNYEDGIALYAEAIKLLPANHPDVERYGEAMRAAEAAKNEVDRA